MAQTVTITIRTVGQCFGCESLIKCGTRTIWTSRVFPYGFSGKAREAAEDKAKAENWQFSA